MIECIHLMDPETCPDCNARAGGVRAGDGTWSGKEFWLVYAPALRADTFMHLNIQGDHWKLRLYPSPTSAPEVFDQSGEASTRRGLNLAEIRTDFRYEIPYAHSQNADGVKVNDSRFWFDEISRRNAEYGIGG